MTWLVGVIVVFIPERGQIGFIKQIFQKRKKTLFSEQLAQSFYIVRYEHGLLINIAFHTADRVVSVLDDQKASVFVPRTHKTD